MLLRQGPPIRNAHANKSDERQMCIIQHTALHYHFTKLVGSPVSKVCPETIITHLFNDRDNGFYQLLLQSPVKVACTLRKPFRIPAIIIHGSLQILCSFKFPAILYVHFYLMFNCLFKQVRKKNWTLPIKEECPIIKVNQQTLSPRTKRISYLHAVRC